jgi:hypothetical protein
MDESDLPVGTDFLDLVREVESQCETRTDDALPKLGVKAPKTYCGLGTVLSLLDRLGSCFWGCQKGDHSVEYLVARAASHGRAALRLMRAGYYDEALTLARGVGELSNLLQLFVVDHCALDEWRKLDEKTRRNCFSALNVRKGLEEQSDLPILVDRDRYGELSGFASHPDPSNSPQAHNLLGVSTQGGYFQEAGVMLVLNELGLAVGGVAVFGGHLAVINEDLRKNFVSAGADLIRSLGGIHVLTREAMWSELLQKPRA